MIMMKNVKDKNKNPEGNSIRSIACTIRVTTNIHDISAYAVISLTNVLLGTLPKLFLPSLCVEKIKTF